MNLSKMSLKQKILASLLGAGLLPLLIVSAVVDFQASNALETQAFNQLVSVRDIQKKQIEAYFRQIRDQAETFSESRMIIDAAKGFRFAFKLLANELDAQNNLQTYKNELTRYYSGDFANEYRKRTGSDIDSNALIPDNALEILAQHQYIAANKHPLGEKHRLDSSADDSSYDDLHQRFHPAIRHYLEKFGYYDIFIVEPVSGTIVYSVFKELDYATSLISGPYKDTNLARAFRQAAASATTSAVYLEDFEPYTPSYDAPASFIASPIFDDGSLVGVLVFQMPVDRINEVMGQRSGLGETGLTYLLGADHLMRSQSPFDEQNSILNHRVESASASAVIAGETGNMIVTQADGESVLSAFTPIEIEGVRWGLLAEINESEAFATITHLHWVIFVLTLVTIATVVALAMSFARGVYRQLGGDPTQIERIARNIADGDLATDDDSIARPIGVYASMLSMRSNLVQSIERDVQHIVNSARQGDLSQRVELSGKRGFYQQLGQGVNELVESCENIVNDTLRVFEGLSKGSLDEIYHSNYQGSFDQVKQNANATIAKLKQTIEGDIQGLVNSAVKGDLSQRIDLSDKQGFFADISTGINDLVDSVERIFGDTSDAIKALAQGKLTYSIKNSYQGDFEELKQNINASISQLEQIVISLREGGESISVSASEVDAGSVNLSARTEQQASALEESASSLEQLTGTVKNTADNSGLAEQVASEARGAAVRGGEVMHEATGAMEEINQSSQKIAEIIGVIDEIAFQTNLLALNASVEAARAGEQGRGFAVVATEVRNLAGRSATAAKEIKELINDSVSKVGKGVGLVKQSSDNLSEIIDGISRVGSIIKEIAAASHEQASGIDMVNKAVANMESLTQQNAALAEETSAAASSMSNQARDMNNRLEFFEISRHISQPKTPARPRPTPSPAVTTQAAPAAPKRETRVKSAPPASASGPTLDDDDDWAEF